jgi:hypothetical protein
MNKFTNDIKIIINNCIDEISNAEYCIYDVKEHIFKKEQGKNLILKFEIIDKIDENTIIFELKNKNTTIKLEFLVNNNNYFLLKIDDELTKNNKIITNYKLLDDMNKLIHQIIFFKIFDNIQISICDFKITFGRFGNKLFMYIWWMLYILQKNNNIETKNILIGTNFKNKEKNNTLTILDIFDTQIINNEYNLNPTSISFKFPYDESVEINEKSTVVSVTMKNKKELMKNFLKILMIKSNLDKIDGAKTSFSDNIVLHFRGSDFCITTENIFNKTTFVTLHFKYYFDSLVDIIKNIKKENITIDIFHHPHDKDIIYLMKIYLKEKLEQVFPTKTILLRDEKEVLAIINLNKLSEMDLIYIIGCYKNIILSNSSLNFWSAIMSSNDAKLYYLYKEPQKYNKQLLTSNYYVAFDKLPLIVNNTICINMANRINDIRKYLFPCYIKLNLNYNNRCICFKNAGMFDYNNISYHIFFIFLKIIYLKERITFTDFSNKILNIEHSENILNSGINNNNTNDNTNNTNNNNNDNDNYDDDDDDYKDDNEYIKMKENNTKNKELIYCYKKIHDIIDNIYKETNTDKRNDKFVKMMIKINKSERINKTNLLIKLIDSMHYDADFNVNIIIEQMNKRIINIIRTYN